MRFLQKKTWVKENLNSNIAKPKQTHLNKKQADKCREKLKQLIWLREIILTGYKMIKF